MDKPSRRTPVEVSWLRRSLASSEVFSNVLDLYNPQQRQSLVSTIAASLQEIIREEDESVYVKGEVAQYVYFVKVGSVSLMTVKDEAMKEIECYCEGDVFGEAEHINMSKRVFVAKARERCQLWALKVEKFPQCFKDYRHKVYPSKLLTFQKSIFFRSFIKKSQLQVISTFSNQLYLIRQQPLYEQGYSSDCLYILTEGEIELQVWDNLTKRNTRICTLEAGNVVGEIEAVSGCMRESRAVVTSETAKVYSIGKGFILDMVSPHLMEQLRKHVHWKQSQRGEMFKRHSQIRTLTEQTIPDLSLRVETDEYSQQTLFLRGVDLMVRNKYKSFRNNFGMSAGQNLKAPPKLEFFNFAAGLRPKILHYKGCTSGVSKKNPNKVPRRVKEDSKIEDVREIRRMYQQEYSSLLLHPRLPPLFRCRSLPMK